MTIQPLRNGRFFNAIFREEVIRTAKDSYFRIVFLILKTLSEAKRTGKKITAENLSAEAFGINESYFLDILEDLKDSGYIRECEIRKDILGRRLEKAGDIRITMTGEEYLQENNMMKKVLEALKDAKDLLF